MEANNKVWVRVTCAGAEYYGRVSLPLSEDFPLGDRIKELFTGSGKVVLEFPHILMRTKMQDGQIMIEPMPLYEPAVRDSAMKCMVLASNLMEVIMPIDSETGIARAIREAEGLVPKIIMTPPPNIVQMKRV